MPTQEVECTNMHRKTMLVLEQLKGQKSTLLCIQTTFFHMKHKHIMKLLKLIPLKWAIAETGNATCRFRSSIISLLRNFSLSCFNSHHLHRFCTASVTQTVTVTTEQYLYTINTTFITINPYPANVENRASS
jgi:hypothetical protein